MKKNALRNCTFLIVTQPIQTGFFLMTKNERGVAGYHPLNFSRRCSFRPAGLEFMCLLICIRPKGVIFRARPCDQEKVVFGLATATFCLARDVQIRER